MKRVMKCLLLVLITGNLQAKKVKFAVDMTGQTISPNGVHVVGDFQAIAGLGADWDPGTALLSQEGSSAIYSLIVNLPAFRKYEYRFTNGNQTYESEFVPEESRVGYNFVDNRWLFVDSLLNDTSLAGSILYGGNAPMGKTLIRYKVDMRTAGAISPLGIHIGTSYQSTAFDPTKIRLYSFGDGIYEMINYVENSTYAFKYHNGNTFNTAETVPPGCSVNGYRSIVVTKDTVLPLVCFSSCSTCLGLGLKQNTGALHPLKLRPNPAKDLLKIEYDFLEPFSLSITDLCGKLVLSCSEIHSTSTVDIKDFPPGIYLVRLTTKNTRTQEKLIVE
ncbi:MAG: T9SS type A sorting domain-containing protein [bacterium]|nr:T9SS type A sorting domain-containing protein [bacterium]